MSQTIRHPASPGGTWRAYPISKQDSGDNFTDWATDSVPLLDPDGVGVYTGQADVAQFGLEWFIFPSNTAPSSWDEAEAFWIGKAVNPLPVDLPFVEAGESYSFKVVYTETQTDPQLRILRDGVNIGSVMASGTDTEFTFTVEIPSNSTKGQTILVHTIEDNPIKVFSALVVGLPTSITVDESANRFNAVFVIQDSNNDIIPSVLVTITRDPDPSAAVIRRGYSNNDGQVEFDLVPGEYYLWRNRDDFSFDDPIHFEMDAEGNITIL